MKYKAMPNNEKDINKIVQGIEINLDITKLSFIFLGFIYVSGYLVRAITLRNYGISEISTVTFHHIEAGVTFLVLTATYSIVPLMGFLTYFQIRKNTNMPNLVIGALGSFLNLYHLFLVVTIFSLFITDREWYLEVGSGWLKAKLFVFFIVYALIALFVLVLLPLVERSVIAFYRNRKTNKFFTKIVELKLVRLVLCRFNQRQVYQYLIEPLRFSGLMAGITFDLLLVKQFAWIRILFSQGVAYFASVIVLTAAFFIIFIYFRKFFYDVNFYFLSVTSFVGIIFVLYMCINAYVYAMVRHIPMNRGGSLPITYAYIFTDDKNMRELPFLRQNISLELTRIGPMYIIESTEDYIYVTGEANREWFKKWGKTFAISKRDFKYIESDRITQGGPREM